VPCPAGNKTRLVAGVLMVSLYATL